MSKHCSTNYHDIADVYLCFKHWKQLKHILGLEHIANDPFTDCEACDYPEWLSDVLRQDTRNNEGATT